MLDAPDCKMHETKSESIFRTLNDDDAGIERNSPPPQAVALPRAVEAEPRAPRPEMQYTKECSCHIELLHYSLERRGRLNVTSRKCPHFLLLEAHLRSQPVALKLHEHLLLQRNQGTQDESFWKCALSRFKSTMSLFFSCGWGITLLRLQPIEGLCMPSVPEQRAYTA